MRNKLAIFVLFGARVCITVLQSEASQALQEQAHFDKPFFAVGFTHSMTALVLPAVVTYFKLFGTKRDRLETSWLEPHTILRRHCVLPLDKLLRIAAFLSAFYFVTDYFWYAALTGVSVTAGIAIFNCSPVFAYCFSFCFLHERLMAGKVLGVLVALAGVALILKYQDKGADHDGDSLSAGDGSLVAGVFVIISAALGAGYNVAYKAAVGAKFADTASVVILSGFIGLMAIPQWIVGTVVLAYSPFASIHESAGWPSTSVGLQLMLCSGVLSLLLDACVQLLLCWTSPLETCVGSMLTIPVSGIFDTVVHRTHFSVECVLGSLFVMTGFGVLEHASWSSDSKSEDSSEDASQPEEEETALLVQQDTPSDSLKPFNPSKANAAVLYSSV